MVLLCVLYSSQIMVFAKHAHHIGHGKSFAENILVQGKMAQNCVNVVVKHTLELLNRGTNLLCF